MQAAMILTGRTLCLPSPSTVNELFSVARDASVIPDISLDPVLTTFLSLDSSAALKHQYAFAQRSMSREQRAEFNLNLTAELGGSRVTNGGIGVVALALSMLFDCVAHQVRAQSSTEVNFSTQRWQPERIFGISTSSRIGSLIHEYLQLIPGIANDEEKMAVTTELYDNWLKLELVDHFERMTTKKRMSTVSMQQWLAGAAIHLHMRIHQVRLQSVPSGSVLSLCMSYKTGVSRLVQGYTTYLHRNIQETAAPGPVGTRNRATSMLRQNTSSSTTGTTCSSSLSYNVSLNGSSDNFNASDISSATPAGISTRCNIDVSGEDFVFNVTKGLNATPVEKINKNTVNASIQHSREEEQGMLGLLVIEPQRNVSHNVHHHQCESPAIQQALVIRIINAQDLERNRNFFFYPEKFFSGLLRQRNDFELI